MSFPSTVSLTELHQYIDDLAEIFGIHIRLQKPELQKKPKKKDHSKNTQDNWTGDQDLFKCFFSDIHTEKKRFLA